MKLKRTAAAVVAAVMAFTAVATPLGDNIPALEEAFSAGAYYSVKDNFYPVTLTGDGAVDMVNVAVAQTGRKDDDDGWYPNREAWCADFVLDVARVAGQTGAVPDAPANAACGTFRNALVKAGAIEVETAQAGDLVFYCSTSGDTTYHVGIMKDSRYSVEGNALLNGVFQVVDNRDTMTYTTTKGLSIANGDIKRVFIRPNYSNSTNDVAVTSVVASELANKINWLSTQYKHGEYWNQYNGSLDKTGPNPCPCKAMGYTWCGQQHNGYCDCKCGVFHGGEQCYGFASKMFYLTFGIYQENAEKIYSINDVCASDVIRYGGTAGHSVFVIKVIGDTIYYVDCNGNGVPCQVRWNATVNKWGKVAGYSFGYRYHMSGNTIKNPWGEPDPTPDHVVPNPSNYPVANNTYTIKNVATGKMMNVYAGTDKDGTKVTLWDRDGTTEQKFRLEHISNGSYWIFAMCSSNGSNRVVDTNIGSDHVCNVGDYIDIWGRGSYDNCQKFNVVSVGNNKYVFELSTIDNAVIGISGSGNGDQLQLQKYQENDNQFWYFCDMNGNVVNPAPHTHSYGAWYDKTKPTCTSAGVQEQKCSCGATKTRETAALGHSWGGWATATKPTCTAQGVEQRTCSRCSKAETRYITALGHNYSSEWTIDKQATCSAEGSKSKHCTRRDAKTEVTVIPKTAHSYKTTVVAPTLTAQGYTLHECTVCHYSYKDSYTSQITLPAVTGVKVKTQGSTSLTLAWDKNASANGYVVEQYKGGKWTQITKTASNAVVSYTVNGLMADTTYTFRIKGYVVSGTTEYSGEYTRLAAKTRIANVASFKGSAVSASAVKLDWSKNDKATGYVIEQYKGGKWTALATTKNNTTLTFTVKGLASATVYSFRIKSFRTVNGKTDYSEYTSLKAATSFGNLSGLAVKSYTASAITLAWNKNASANGYIIEQYKGGKWVQIAKTASNAVVSYTVSGLAADTTYTFRVRAYKTAAGKTIYSEYARLAAKTRIAKVATFTGSAVSASAVKLDWSRNDKATGYVIEQYKGGKWTVLATTKNNTTLTFTVKGLAKGTIYSFRIKAFRKTGSTTEFSEYSGLKAATRK